MLPGVLMGCIFLLQMGELIHNCKFVDKVLNWIKTNGQFLLLVSYVYIYQ